MAAINYTNSISPIGPHLIQSHLSPTNPTNPTTTTPSLSFSPRRRRRRNSLNKKNPSPSSPPESPDNPKKLKFILDVDQFRSSTRVDLVVSKFRHLVGTAVEVCEDLRTLVTVEKGSNRVVVSCEEKSVRFVGGVLVWSCVGVVVVRFLVGLGMGVARRGWGGGKEEVVTRRDRSLGGKEVVVARRVVGGGGEVVGRGSVGRGLDVAVARGERRRKVPGWWVENVPRPVGGVNKEEYQREANHFVQAIMDDKLRGKDVSEEDILEDYEIPRGDLKNLRVIHLRRICRQSGVQLSFGTDNARDSLYRLSVHNVINTCCKVRSPSVQIDGEDARTFVAGLANDIGLTNSKAATIVSAAVAAQTRQWFLQAWALEMQAKSSEAKEELTKICLIHHIFPPEPSSPEMEMVARGLQKHLTLDQREFLLNQLVGVCGDESRRSAVEALGLV